MSIVEFENRNEAPLMVSVEPWGQRYEVPHLARAGIRYSVREGAEDRCYSVLSGQQIEFWCNSDSYEIDIVCPSPAEKLMWDICVTGGWCGGIVGGKPTTVGDLLPASGSITAQEFAKLVVRADGWPPSRPPDEKHLRWLESKFIEHLGGPSVEAEVLHKTSPAPFPVEAS